MVALATQTSALWDMQFTERMGVKVVCGEVDVASQFFFHVVFVLGYIKLYDKSARFSLGIIMNLNKVLEENSQQLQKSDGIVSQPFYYSTQKASFYVITLPSEASGFKNCCVAVLLSPL